ncbi:Pupal cuticle protein [Amphibalanus amphitrite]|uniref:Pupal cuticle protein n=1 Tax=Amphibalanus amphitrite TaxID=1232801 RepID=A0A6A4VNN7_AMPAM|nr:pupal cuticle protein-like [Amphibalanus amphitrite]XP_043208144.1 pupal cuticle protein-like [Amphibalanus amphitrite]KAF0297767.1 Pupal cuticle protein [Amphibalanus amphitrite]
MKLFVLFALVAVAACQYVPGSDKEAQILKNEFEQAIDNSYRSDVETTNGIVQQAAGESIPGPEPETGTSRQKGSYQYVTPEGQTIRVDWEADEFGYRAVSDAIPKAPLL